MKRVLVNLTSMLTISGFLLLMGYLFDIRVLMIRYVEETSTGLESGGSILAVVIGVLCGWIIDKVKYGETVS
ncbi:hypothetical protein FZW96_14460 [Bacillus sp. BGMRC 2118]|nr:hypothetical protein FZW96_14460 [Bacillus sp. BGMRC 2118]